LPGILQKDGYFKLGRGGKNAFDFWNGEEPIFVPYGYKNKEEVERTHKKAFRRFYLRPRYILGRIKKIRSFFDIVRYIKGLRMVIRFFF